MDSVLETIYEALNTLSPAAAQLQQEVKSPTCNSIIYLKNFGQILRIGMATFSVFLSIVCVFRNQANTQEKIISEISDAISSVVSDYEIIIIDNASTDESIVGLKRLTGENGFSNLQVYALTKAVDLGAASWVGVENALGDFVAVIDPLVDDAKFLPKMLEQAMSGVDVVFANNELKPKQGLPYSIASRVFNGLFKWFNGINLSKEAPQYRVISRTVLNFILKHSQPVLAYRYLPASAGFHKITLNYKVMPKGGETKSFGESFDRGMRLLMSTTRAPMRLVTSFSLFGAFANIFYSIYVIAIGFLKTDVAPGWITLSLQQSGMFLLISLVLFVLGEYILNMASLSNENPINHISKEFTSVKMTRREKLNVEEVIQL